MAESTHAPVESPATDVRSGSRGITPILSNAGWLMAQRTVGFFLVFLVSVLIARYFGVKGFGTYSYALSFVTLFTVVTDLGLDNVVVRSLVDGTADRGELLGTAFILKLLAGCAAFILAAVAILLINDNSLIRILTIVISGTLILRSANVIDFWFQSKVMSKYLALSYLSAVAISAGLRIMLIFGRMSIFLFALVVVVEQLLIGVGLVFWFKRLGFDFRSWRYKTRLAKTMLLDSWPLVFSGLSVVVYMKIDQIMLGQMVGPSSVGVYAAAVTLSEGWAFIPMAVATSVFPALVRLRQKGDSAHYVKRMQAFYDVMALIGFVVAIFVSLIANRLVGILFGAGYEGTAPILVVHIWSFVFICLGVARTQWLIAENMTRFSMFTTGLGATINIALNLILIPRYAGLGAAWATLISYAVASYLSCVFSARVRPAFKQLTLALFSPLRLPAVLASIRELR